MPVNTFCLEKSSQVGGWGKEVIVFRAVVDKSKNIAAGVKKLEKCFKRTNSKGLTHSKIYSSLCPSILSHSLPLSLSLPILFLYIITFYVSLLFLISPPLHKHIDITPSPRGSPGECPDGHFLSNAEGFGPVPAPITLCTLAS